MDEQPVDLTSGPVPGRFDAYCKRGTTQAARIGVPFVVDTTEGRMTGRAGDWLAVDTAGNRYPIAAEVFAASYVPAVDA